jgi:superfamily II RNA helicase
MCLVAQVVIATDTLAFGVNMPCRTAVFALDSKSLTPTMYRQMSGMWSKLKQPIIQ